MGSTTISFHIEGVDAQPANASIATIYMTEGRHDIAELTINSKNQSTIASIVSHPISIHWGTVIGSRDFIGYVDTPKSSSERNTIGREITLYALGASSVLRDSVPRVWTGANPVTIATDIVDAMQIGLVMDAYPHNVDYFSQIAEESGMTTLKRLARHLGYSMVPDGAVILMIDPRKELSRAKSSSCKVFDLPRGVTISSTNVESFSSEISDSPYGSDFKNYAMTGIDALGNVFTYNTAYAPEFGDTVPTVTSQHPGRFDSLSKAIIESERVSRMARWAMTASMTCRGDANLRPGMYIYLVDNVGPSGGFWYITEVIHQISIQPDTYWCKLQLCKEPDSVRTKFQAVTAVPNYQYSPVIGGTGKWRSSRRVVLTT